MVDRLERLINLVIALRESGRPLAAEEIRQRVAGYGQDDHEAFRRMFERDKSDLRNLGVPVEVERLGRWDDRTGYRIRPAAYDLQPVRLDPDELAALALALQATGLADEGLGGLRKLEVDAGEPGAGGQRSAVGMEVDLDAPHRAVVMEAQLTRTTVRFRYRPATSPAGVRTVDPYAIVHRNGRWYLVGRDHDRQDRRAFRLDRIEGRVRTVGEPGSFAAPEDEVRVDDVVPVSGPPVEAEVVASPAVAWQVARRARGGGRPEADGWTAYVVAAADPDELLGWVLEFGPEVELRRPPELRERLIARLERAADGGQGGP